MQCEQILAVLKANEHHLHARGILHIALFGSRARDDHRANSDTDILIETDPAVSITVYDYVSLKDHISGLFDGRVDVVNRDGLKPYLRPAVTAAAVYSF